MRGQRVDKNQAEIVTALRAVGALVILTYRQGDGCPDAFVWFRGKWTAHELKSPTGRLTTGQQILQTQWPGTVYVSRSIDEALAAIGAQVI